MNRVQARMGDKAWSKGSKHVARPTNCKSCGTTVMRKVHFVDAKCDPCRRKNSDQNKLAREAREREEQRRYRILCHLLGWSFDQWADMLEEARTSPMAFRKHPESRAVRYDLALSAKYLRRLSVIHEEAE